MEGGQWPEGHEPRDTCNPRGQKRQEGSTPGSGRNGSAHTWTSGLLASRTVREDTSVLSSPDLQTLLWPQETTQAPVLGHYAAQEK